MSVTAEQIEQFGAGMRGKVIGRDDAAYDEARALYNRMIDKRPFLIAQCHDFVNVLSAVAFG
jgi:hypothetical protein